jgi:hypothetical protein
MVKKAEKLSGTLFLDEESEKIGMVAPSFQFGWFLQIMTLKIV